MQNSFVKLIVIIFVFLIFAGCAWNINPGHWGDLWRFLCIVCMIIVILKDVD